MNTIVAIPQDEHACPVTQAVDVLSKVSGWEDWMKNWVSSDLVQLPNDVVPCGKRIYYCFHPDYECFLATTDPEEAVAAFSKEKFKFD